MFMFAWMGLAFAGWEEDRQADYKRFFEAARLQNDTPATAVLGPEDSERINLIAGSDKVCAPAGTVYPRTCNAITGQRTPNACAALASLAAVQLRFGSLDRGEDIGWQVQLRCGADTDAVVATAGARPFKAGDPWADGRVEVAVRYAAEVPIFSKTVGTLPAIPLSPNGAKIAKALATERTIIDAIAPVNDALEALRVAATAEPSRLAAAAAQAKQVVVPAKAALLGLGLGASPAATAAVAYVLAVDQAASAAQTAITRFPDPARAAQDWAVEGARIGASARLAEVQEAFGAQARAIGADEPPERVSARQQLRVYADHEGIAFAERLVTTFANVATDPSFGAGAGRAGQFLTENEAPWQAAVGAVQVVDDPVIGTYTQVAKAYAGVLQRERDAMAAAAAQSAQGTLPPAQLGAALSAAMDRIQAEQTKYAAAMAVVAPKVGF